MTVILSKNYPKMNLRKLAIAKINNLIYSYQNKFDIESIHFEKPIDGIKYFKSFPHYSETDFVTDWHSTRIKSDTLVKIIKCLKYKEFYGFTKTTDGKLIKIKPKRNV